MNIAKQSTFRQLLVILFCFLSFASLESVAICEVDLAPSKTAVHLTNQVGKEGIEASRYLNGPSSAWTFASESVPKYGFTKLSSHWCVRHGLQIRSKTSTQQDSSSQLSSVLGLCSSEFLAYAEHPGLEPFISTLEYSILNSSTTH